MIRKLHRIVMASQGGTSLRARFVSGAWWALVGAVVSRSMTLGASIVAGRVLGVEVFGRLGVIQSTIGVFAVLAGAGLGLAATKYVAQYRRTDAAKTRDYLTSALQVSLVTGLAISLLFFVLSPWLAARFLNDSQLTMELRLASALVLFGAVSGVQSGVLIGYENFRTIAWVNGLRGATMLVTVSLGAMRAGLRGAVLGLVLSELSAVVAGQVAIRRLEGGLGRLSQVKSARVRELWRFALPALLASVVVQPALWASSLLLVNQPGGFAAMGLYSAADKWRQLILFLPTSISSIVLPMLTSLHADVDRAGYRKLLMANLGVGLAASVVPVILIIIFAPTVMLAYGPEFVSGRTTLVLLALSAIPIVANGILGQAIVSVGRIWLRFFLDASLAVLLLIVSWLLIPTSLQNGLAIGNLVAYTCVAVMLAIIVWRRRDAQPIEEQIVAIQEMP